MVRHIAHCPFRNHLHGYWSPTFSTLHLSPFFFPPPLPNPIAELKAARRDKG